MQSKKACRSMFWPMQKIWIIIPLTFALGCGGTLTPEQREKARRAIEEGKIKRITPAQLTETALEAGKKIVTVIGGQDPFLNDKPFLDSLAMANQVVIYALRPDMKNLSKEELAIAEAYQAQGDISNPVDNVQKLSGDSLLYTLPVGNERPDGSKPFSHAIAVKMAVKQVVLMVKE
jgi:hypothetical protein